MSTKAGPNLINDGLILHLDIANPLSYDNVNNTILNDVSQSKYSGTILNSATYNNTFNGSLTFDGINDYISIPNFSGLANSTGCTISIWSYILQAKGYHFWGNNIFLLQIQTNGTYRLRFNLDGTWRSEYTTPFTLNTWHKLDITWDGTNTIFYMNGNIVVNSTIDSIYNSFTNTTNQPLEISRRDIDYSNSIISKISIYNRSLSNSEILQNFNSIKERYNF